MNTHDHRIVVAPEFPAAVHNSPASVAPCDGELDQALDGDGEATASITPRSPSSGGAATFLRNTPSTDTDEMLPFSLQS